MICSMNSCCGSINTSVWREISCSSSMIMSVRREISCCNCVNAVFSGNIHAAADWIPHHVIISRHISRHYFACSPVLAHKFRVFNTFKDRIWIESLLDLIGEASPSTLSDEVRLWVLMPIFTKLEIKWRLLKCVGSFCRNIDRRRRFGWKRNHLFVIGIVSWWVGEIGQGETTTGGTTDVPDSPENEVVVTAGGCINPGRSMQKPTGMSATPVSAKWPLQPIGLTNSDKTFDSLRHLHVRFLRFLDENILDN